MIISEIYWPIQMDLLLRLENFRVAKSNPVYNNLEHASELYWTAATKYVPLLREGSLCPNIELNFVSLDAANASDAMTHVGKNLSLFYSELFVHYYLFK